MNGVYHPKIDELGQLRNFFGRQRVCSSLIALRTKIRVSFHLSVNLMGRDSRKDHARAALLAGHRRGFSIRLEHWMPVDQQ